MLSILLSLTQLGLTDMNSLGVTEKKQRHEIYHTGSKRQSSFKLMAITNDRSKPVVIPLLVFVLLNSIFLASVGLLPFVDLPNHLAEATIYKYYAPANLLGKYYQPTPWYFPNTFHTVFCSLFPSVEWGNKVFHIMYIVLLHGSMFLAIKQLRGNAWYGLLGILLTYNYNVSFGFVGFAISIPVLILLFYVILLYIDKERMYLNFIIGVLLILLFLMHAQNALLGLMVYGAMIGYHFRKSFGRLITHGLLVSSPVVIIIVAWWFTRTTQEEGSTLEYLKEYYSSGYFQNFTLRFGVVAFDNFQLREGIPGILIASVFFLCMLIPVLFTRPWKWKLSSRSLTPESIYAGIFFLIVLGCYLLAPHSMPGQAPIFQRFCTILILSFMILASIPLSTVNIPWLKYYVIIAISTYSLFWFEYIYSFNRENQTFSRELFDGMESEKKLAGLIYDNAYRGRNVYIHFPNYYIVWNKGVAASKIIDYRFGVVRRVAPETELPFYQEMIGEQYGYQSQYSNIDYFLVRGKAPVENDMHLRGFSLWRQAEPWKIYKKSADNPLPKP